MIHQKQLRPGLVSLANLQFIPSTISFDQPGCWAVTPSYREDDVLLLDLVPT